MADNESIRLGGPKLFLPPWLRDETLFSLCSRSHCLSKHTRPSETSLDLFGAKLAGFKHDLPSNLSYFSETTSHRLGGAKSILEDHTILPFFAPFQSSDVMGRVIRGIEGVSSSTKADLGILASRFGAHHPLKACLDCMQEDMAIHGVAYWHRQHQLPGAFVCVDHSTLLFEYAYKHRWKGRFDWALPQHHNLLFYHQEAEAERDRKLLQLAHSSLALLRIGFSRCFDPVRVCQLYLHAIAQLVMPKHSSTSALCMSVAGSYLSFVEALRCCFEPGSLPATTEDAKLHLERMIRTPRVCPHPLRHLILISWLFGNLERFVDEYDAISPRPSSKRRKVRRVGAEPMHPEQRAQRTEITGTHALRPKVLKPDIRSLILTHLAQGMPKDHICQQFSISISTLNKLLRREAAVQSAWSLERKSLEIRLRRQAWLALVSERPQLSATAIRALDRSTYAWLYRNDREWLQEQTAVLPYGRIGNNSKVDWHARDCELAEALMKNLSCLGSDNSPAARVELLTRMPALARCLLNYGRYPITRALVDELTLPR